MDLARALPPEHPKVFRRPKNAVFFNLLRPEFLEVWKKHHKPPLSPDALVQFTSDAVDNAFHNTNCEHASHFLRWEHIPSVAAKLLTRTLATNDTPTLGIPYFLHQHGVPS